MSLFISQVALAALRSLSLSLSLPPKHGINLWESHLLWHVVTMIWWYSGTLQAGGGGGGDELSDDHIEADNGGDHNEDDDYVCHGDNDNDQSALTVMMFMFRLQHDGNDINCGDNHSQDDSGRLAWFQSQCMCVFNTYNACQNAYVLKSEDLFLC